jgi:phenylpropionate dioxygenase-like ring-hydroxylating dioxygenase large terminal subunit
MYINFWYPICTAQDLEEAAPVRSEVLGHKFVAFRDDSGQAHVLADTCVHRGGSLSKGSVKDDCIVCPYHGWRYSGDGRCRLVPSLDDKSKPPARAKVDSYPVQEIYGIIFAFLGDVPEKERPPIFEIEEYGQDGWRASEIMILNVPCYYERSMENGLDFAHNEFVHPLQGSPKVFMDTMKIEDNPWGMKISANMGEDDASTSRMENVTRDPNTLGASSLHHGPNTLVTTINFSATNRLTQYFFEAPENENHTKIYFINMRNCMLDPAMDDRVREINLNITAEDIEILENLFPVRTPETTTKEILMPADEGITRFRNYLKEWQRRGWRLDAKTLRKARGDVAYAIPCPDRRTSGNWVLDPVPVLPSA